MGIFINFTSFRTKKVEIIQNKIIVILGDPGKGKTLISSYYTYWYFINNRNIFSNVDYFYQKKEYWPVNYRISTIGDLEKIEFQKEKGLIVMDESGVNINSRRSMSEQNLEISKLTFLSRKINCDLIYIGQIEGSIDKNIRDIATFTIHMNSWFAEKDYLVFEMEVYKKEILLWFKKIDLFRFVNETSFFYSSTEISKIFDINKEIKKMKNELNLEKLKKQYEKLEKKN